MSDQIVIRRAHKDDAEAIIEVQILSIREICSRDYTPGEIDAWTGRTLKPELIKQTIERDFVWVAEKNLTILGFSHLAIMDADSAELMGLYLRPLTIGQGLGEILLNEGLKVCHEKGMKFLNLFSTLNAKTFYERNGFINDQPITTIDMQCVPIPCYPMRKYLS